MEQDGVILPRGLERESFNEPLGLHPMILSGYRSLRARIAFRCSLLEAERPWHVVVMPHKKFSSGHLTAKDAHARATQANTDAEENGSETRYAVVPRSAPAIPQGWVGLGP